MIPISIQRTIIPYVHILPTIGIRLRVQNVLRDIDGDVNETNCLSQSPSPM